MSLPELRVDDAPQQAHEVLGGGCARRSRPHFTGEARVISWCGQRRGTSGPPGHPEGARRQHPLRHLPRAGPVAASPLATADIAETLDLHPNTVRPHLERMRDVGLLAVESDPRGGPGRPQHRYSLAPDAPASASSRRRSRCWPACCCALAEATGAGAEEARNAGRDQGQADAARASPGASCLDAVTASMAALGFDPAVAAEDGVATRGVHPLPVPRAGRRPTRPRLRPAPGPGRGFGRRGGRRRGRGRSAPWSTATRARSISCSPTARTTWTRPMTRFRWPVDSIAVRRRRPGRRRPRDRAHRQRSCQGQGAHRRRGRGRAGAARRRPPRRLLRLQLRDVLRHRRRHRRHHRRLRRREGRGRSVAARSCSPAPRSTTRTASSRPASRSTTPTRSAPAAAGRASPSRPQDRAQRSSTASSTEPPIFDAPSGLKCAPSSGRRRTPSTSIGQSSARTGAHHRAEIDQRLVGGLRPPRGSAPATPWRPARRCRWCGPRRAPAVPRRGT